VACSEISALRCCAGYECIGGEPPLFEGACRRACTNGARRCTATGACCPADRTCCNGVCCPFGQHCINGACGCLDLGATCDPANSTCCQYEETVCYSGDSLPPGVPAGSDRRECCRPIGGSCDPNRDRVGESDCCNNSYAGGGGSILFGPCGWDSMCGGYDAVCAADEACVSGQCLGRCNNQFPVKRCKAHAECDCDGDLEDGCVDQVGFCRHKRCTAP
jgi:hypothetical protein